MKNGLINENGILRYYKDDKPVHAGVIKENDAIYYIGKDGIAATGRHIVHHQMTNGLLERGTYTFGEDGKLIEGSYIPPKKKKRKRKIRLKRRIKRWFKKKAHKKFSIFIMTIVLLLIGTAIIVDNMEAFIDPNQSITQQNGEIQLPTFESDVYLCSKGAQRLYRGEITVMEAARYGDPYVPFVFEYNLKGSDGLLTISERADMHDSVSIFMRRDRVSLVIDNLKTNTTYYYTVFVNGKEYNGSFHTAPSTRFLDIDGIYNVRDIGGYVTLDGKTVKQGMVIRGTELDALVVSGYRLTEAGRKTINSFGFVYDMDLRAESIFTGYYVSPLGKDVRHKFYTAPQYGQIFSSAYKESLRQIFSDMANPANYPMYVHCSYGQDRTGTVIFLLQGILNMPEDQMIREYEMTEFHNPGFSADGKISVIEDLLAGKEGDTLQEKIVNFLINDIGVTQGEIDSIRNILLQ